MEIFWEKKSTFLFSDLKAGSKGTHGQAKVMFEPKC